MITTKRFIFWPGFGVMAVIGPVKNNTTPKSARPLLGTTLTHEPITTQQAAAAPALLLTTKQPPQKKRQYSLHPFSPYAPKRYSGSGPKKEFVMSEEKIQHSSVPRLEDYEQARRILQRRQKPTDQDILKRDIAELIRSTSVIEIAWGMVLVEEKALTDPDAAKLFMEGMDILATVRALHSIKKTRDKSTIYSDSYNALMKDAFPENDKKAKRIIATAKGQEYTPEPEKQKKDNKAKTTHTKLIDDLCSNAKEKTSSTTAKRQIDTLKQHFNSASSVKEQNAIAVFLAFGVASPPNGFDDSYIEKQLKILHALTEADVNKSRIAQELKTATRNLKKLTLDGDLQTAVTNWRPTDFKMS